MDKKIIASFVAGLMVVFGGMGITSAIKEDVEPLQGEQGIQGEVGEVGVGTRGYTGADGIDGTDGTDGVDGVKGEKGDSVTVAEVLAAIEAQEAIEEVEYSFTNNGVGMSTVVSLPIGTYDISISHVGAGYFGASLNGNGQNTILVSQDGYVVSEQTINITEDGDYTINVTTEGQWTLDIVKQ